MTEHQEKSNEKRQFKRKICNLQNEMNNTLLVFEEACMTSLPAREMRDLQTAHAQLAKTLRARQ